MPVQHSRSNDTPIRPRILCLDDDESVLLSIRMLLEHFGFDVSVFQKHCVAFEAFSASPTEFKLLIVDQCMPGKTGLEFAKEIKSVRNTVPIAITSGYIDSELQREAEQLGVNAVIDKPIAVKEFIAVIRSLIADHSPS